MAFSLPYELFISLRYLRAKRRQRSVSTISLISTAGVAVGVMALIVVMAVMSGFEYDLRNKILGTNAHIWVLRYGERGIMYTHMEAGHVGTNVFLQAESLGLGAGIVGAFEDRGLSMALKLPRDYVPLLVMPVGFKR